MIRKSEKIYIWSAIIILGAIGIGMLVFDIVQGNSDPFAGLRIYAENIQQFMKGK